MLEANKALRQGDGASQRPEKHENGEDHNVRISIVRIDHSSLILTSNAFIKLDEKSENN